MVKNLPAMQETQDPSLGRKDPLEKEMATHSNIFAGRILWTEAIVHGVAKSPTGVVSHFNFLDLLFSHQVVLDSFETPWTIARQAFLSFTIFRTLLKFTSIQLVILPNHLNLDHHLLIYCVPDCKKTCLKILS